MLPSPTGDPVKETLRLSDAPSFRQILIAFASRLNPDLRLDQLVLTNISTTLTYHDGRTFTYTLDPAN